MAGTKLWALVILEQGTGGDFLLTVSKTNNLRHANILQRTREIDAFKPRCLDYLTALGAIVARYDLKP